MAFGLAETAKLAVDLSLTGNFSRSLAGAQKQLGSFDRAIDRTQGRAYKAGTQIGTGIKRGLAIAATGTAVFAGLMVKAVGSASDLNETISKTKVVFGPAAEEVLKFGKTSATALGLSEQAADEAAATYGNLFVSMGLVPKNAAKMSTSLVQLAGDLASFNNVSPEEALEALRSGLVGETEPLRKFGVNLNEQTLKAEALKLGLVKLKKGQKEYTQVLTPAQKAQAAYALIFEQTKTAQGDYARTSSGLANQLRTLKANFSNLAATLGTAVLPQIAKITAVINSELAKPENIETVKRLGEAVAGLFTDENIRAGTGLIKGFIESAVAAAPILEATAKTTLTIVQAAVSLFKSLPAPLQQLAVGAFAVNKLTGGLVTNIGGAVAGGLTEFFLKKFAGAIGIQAAVVNVNGGVVNGGGGGNPITTAATGLTGAVAGVGLTGLAIIGGIQGALVGAAGQIAGEVGKQIQSTVGAGPVNVFGPIDRLVSALQGDLRSPLEKVEQSTKVIGPKLDVLRGQVSQASVRNSERQEAIRSALASARAGAISDSNSEKATVRSVAAQQIAKQSAAQAAITGRLSEVRGAIARQKLSVTFAPKLNISIQALTQKQQIVKKFYLQPK